jgi:hypothetical protein
VVATQILLPMFPYGFPPRPGYPMMPMPPHMGIPPPGYPRPPMPGLRCRVQDMFLELQAELLLWSPVFHPASGGFEIRLFFRHVCGLLHHVMRSTTACCAYRHSVYAADGHGSTAWLHAAASHVPSDATTRPSACCSPCINLSAPSNPACRTRFRVHRENPERH